MIVVFLLTLYCAGGAIAFYYSDRKQMKKEVPYGDFPAVSSLGLIRKTALFVFMVIGTGVMIVLTVRGVVHQFSLRLAIFRFNRMLKMLGHKKRIRLAQGHKLTWK